VSALGDDSEDVRRNVCIALGNIGDKAATNEVITKLGSALGDESVRIRYVACEALGRIGEKAATNEVITKLVSALGDKSVLVRYVACEALGRIDEKVATNEVITKLVSALEDESEDVRSSACKGLTKMGEKAATNQVITNIMTVHDIDGRLSSEAAGAIDGILSSSTSIIGFDPTLILQICWWNRELKCVKNILTDESIIKFFDTRNPDWLPLVAYITLETGAALVITEDTVMVYDKREPVVLHISDLKLRQELIGVLTNQAKQLHLCFEIPSNVLKKC
jgi:HEAT repeat protein